jgi:predicted transcriptional regulator of viral defense system
MKSETQTMRAREYVDELSSSGQYHLTSAEALAALKSSDSAVKRALSRLIQQGVLASPARGFYMIIPPEYRSLGSLPPDQFIPALMGHLGLTYYAGLLSAAQYYGAAHHRPQEFQVLVERPHKPIKCGRVRVRFIKRKDIEAVSVQSFNTPRGIIRVSTPEATAIDLVGFVRQAGGLDQVATILSELGEEIDSGKLLAAAKIAPIPWLQRLGYLLEEVGHKDLTGLLQAHVSQEARDYAPLQPSNSNKSAPRSERWKLIINVDVEAEI